MRAVKEKFYEDAAETFKVRLKIVWLSVRKMIKAWMERVLEDKIYEEMI